jgi:hypothetical protein
MLPFPATEDGPVTERETLPPPTIPVPRMSEVRIRVNRRNDIVDLVTADLQLDPRSEEFIGGPEQVPQPRPRMALPPKPVYSLPAGPRDLRDAPEALLASDVYFTRPQRHVMDARHLPSIRVTKKITKARSTRSKKSA